MTQSAYSSLKLRSILFILTVCAGLLLTACTKLDEFEKNISVPQNKWAYTFKPSFGFYIQDTTASYNLYVVLRHKDAYRYNNIWLNIGTQSPGDSIRYQKFELQLGSDVKGWEGTGMDDIWELRKLITNGPVKFNKSGTYNFSLAQIMRENPLPNIMSVGIRVEKVK